MVPWEISVCFTVQYIICTGFSIDVYFWVDSFCPQPGVSHPNKLKFPVCCHMLILPSPLEVDDVVLFVGLLKCVLWLGLYSAEVSPASSELEPGMQQNWTQRFTASWTVTHTCSPVLPLRLSIIYFNLILLKRSVIQQEFVEVIWFCLLKKLGLLQQNTVQKFFIVKENFYLFFFFIW